VLRAQAKRSSAANRDGSATRGPVFGRRDSATRASSLSADGSGAPSHLFTRFAIGLLVAALALLAVAPSAMAVTTRAKTATFGPAGGGACPGAALATGTGDLATAAGFGDRTALATGTGNLTSGSTAVSNFGTSSGTFSVGQSISGAGIPAGTTIAATGSGTLTLSNAATSNGTRVSLVSGSKTIANLATSAGTFAVGMTLSGTGIAPGTTITATDPGRLTLSTGVTAVSGTVALSAGVTEVGSVVEDCGTFSVGQSISGAGIPAGTTIAATGSGTLTLSKPATAAGTGVRLTASSSFRGPNRLAFDQAGDEFYALEVGSNKLHAFDTPSLSLPGSAFPLSVSSAVSLGGRFDIAVDDTNGRIYYLSDKIYGFDSAGVPLGGRFPLGVTDKGLCSIAVDSSGNIFTGSTGGVSDQVIRRFDSAGNPLATIATSLTSPCSLAIDSNDDLWTAHIGIGNPKKWTVASGYTSFTQPLEGASGGINVEALAVDAANNLYVAMSDRVAVHSSAGAFLYNIADSIPGRSIAGVTVDAGTDTAYVSDDGSAQKVYAYGPAQNYADATATPTAATDVLATSAKIGATIDDNNAAETVWRLEISSNGGSSWSTVNSGMTAGNQTGAVVSATATGLSLNTDYRFRVVTNKGIIAANDVPSAQLSFRTLNPANATATPTAAQNISFFSAGIGATIDDNGPAPTSWRLEISSNGGSSWSTVNSGETAGNQAGVAVSATATGLSLNADYQFRVVTNKGTRAATEVASGPLAFRTLDPPRATATPTAARAITDVSAEIGATINDNSIAPTIWRLEISADGGVSWRTVSSGSTTGSQTGVAVSATATGLNPNSRYGFRVVTNKGSGSPDAPSFPLFFKTVAPLPVITDVGAANIADTSVRLIGTIDPRNTDTGYAFEYGTTPALGSSTVPVNIGSGNTPTTVNRVVSGLSPDTTYFFRLVATNLTGTAASASETFHTRTDPLPPAQEANCANEAIRQAQGSADLPECRAYEMASPPDKNQGGVDQGFNALTQAASQDGEASHYCTSALFGDPPAQQSRTCAPYISRRTADGWETFAMEPRYCGFDPGSGTSAIGHTWISPNFDRAVLGRPEYELCSVAPLDPDTPYGNVLYRADYGADPFGYDLLTPRVGNHAPGPEPDSFFATGDADFSHVVYQDRSAQTADASAGDFSKLYDWTEEGSDGCVTPGGCLSLASIRPDGNPFTTASIVPTTNDQSADAIYSAVSEDGERIYFQNGLDHCTNSDRTCQVYMREGGATTFDVSASECTRDCGADASSDKFLWANPAGDVALIESCAKLTDASAPATSCPYKTVQTTDNFKLYRWDRNQPGGARLIDISVDNEPSDGSQPQGLDLVGASDDGNTIFFVANGQIVSGEPAPTLGGTTPTGMKLYRWTHNGGSPRVDYLAPYVSIHGRNLTNTTPASEINRDNVSDDPNINRRFRRVTPGGRYLMITTPLALDPAVDRDPDIDAYRWDEAGGWVCASCQEPGAPSAGDNETSRPHLDRSHFLYSSSSDWPTWTMSADGQRIFFSSLDALVPEDTNGEVDCPRTYWRDLGFAAGSSWACEDVYEWHDGTVSLLSGGDQPSPSIFVGADPDGRNVHFTTAQRLVGWDTDTATDVYVARSGGGFAEPDPVPPTCEGEACRGAGSEAPNTTGAGSAVFQGPGNPRPQTQTRKPRCPRGKRKVTRNGRTRCVAKRGNRGNKRAAKHNRRAAR
jgi:hypothetical protein